jgi:hypothetical protein
VRQRELTVSHPKAIKSLMKLIPATAAVLCLAATLLSGCGDEGGASSVDVVMKPEGATYKIQVTFTPRTITRLKDIGEKATIANMFYGLASKATLDADKADGVGQVQLGETMRDIEPQNQVVSVAVPPFQPAKTAQTEGPPMLLINVYSARKKHADNLLECGIFDAELAKAEAEPIKIECDLIEAEVTEPKPEFVPPADRS